MKKIFASIVLPNLAAAAIIGSGFSVWFFGENQDSVSTNASIKVENLMRIGDLTTSSSTAVLHLDQTKGVRAAILGSEDYVKSEENGNADGKSNYNADKFNAMSKTAAKGLYLTLENDKTDGFNGKINYTAPTDGTDNFTGGWKYKIVTTFTFSGNLEKFVGMVTPTDDAKGTWDVSAAATGKYTFTWNDDVYEMKLPVGTGEDTGATFKFEYLKYNSSKHYLKAEGGSIDGIDAKRTSYTDASSVMATVEPHTDKEYSFMKQSVEGTPATPAGALKIETVATIIEA